jgi:hypothetical protein
MSARATKLARMPSKLFGDPIGAVLAATGIVCGFVAVWSGSVLSVSGGGASYWSDGTQGGLLFILACISALSLVGWVLFRRRSLVLTLASAGSLLFGIYLFEPITASHPGSASWLGLCTGLIPLAALMSAPAPQASPWPSPALKGVALVALGGFATLLTGLWLEVLSFGLYEGSTYWSFGSAGHKLGVVLLALALVAIVFLAALLLGEPVPFTAPTVFAGIASGLTLFLPSVAAFDAFDLVRHGVWVAGGGSLVFLASATALAAMRCLRD